MRNVCRSLEAAVDAAAKFLNKAVKPVLVGGVKLRPLRAEKEFVELADACGESCGAKAEGIKSGLAYMS